MLRSTREVPREALQSIDGFEFAVQSPTEILQAAAERIIDYDKTKPFQLILR